MPLARLTSLGLHCLLDGAPQVLAASEAQSYTFVFSALWDSLKLCWLLYLFVGSLRQAPLPLILYQMSQGEKWWPDVGIFQRAFFSLQNLGSLDRGCLGSTITLLRIKKYIFYLAISVNLNENFYLTQATSS